MKKTIKLLFSTLSSYSASDISMAARISEPLEYDSSPLLSNF